ncbi:MAG: FAD-dependent oxidoreductase [Alphaproteobacteria bacterium]|jgi:protoporphyrinogen oxidase|nr:FAD-dependent oxidoreductase [Alphaproteobacteria bacterium]MDP6516679.1 FAD-dependent oxidoreductase [Alphaproteobacteria bacterium]
MTPHVVILGAGPAGLGAAYRLRQAGTAAATVIERGATVGGNAASFPLAGMQVDYGSHRLHPQCDPAVLGDLRSLLGADLIERPRHGRIRLRGRWIGFPLAPLDLLLHLPPGSAAGAAWDMVRAPLLGPAPEQDSFATVLERGLGRTICRDFYFPYARKIWGVAPEQLSPVQARRRVAASSSARLIAKVLSAVPGLGGKAAGRFFYPRHGFGQICARLRDAAVAAGAEVLTGTEVTAVSHRDGAVTGITAGGHALDADHVWSTIPITTLARLMTPPAPADLRQAAGRLSYRAMILVYLVVATPRFTEFDAHYFPEAAIAISRLSEPKNYGLASEPAARTVLCAELPCAVDSEVWRMSDEDLGALVLDALAGAGIPVRAPVEAVISRRLAQGYPIYERGFEHAFDALDQWLGGFDRLLTFGRQGLFAHDNTHHALAMAYAACDCLRADGAFDKALWHRHRRAFEHHVVVD